MNLLSWSRPVSVAALAFTAIAACSEPTGYVPKRFDGMYVATSLGGGQVPLTLTIDGEQRTLLADTLRFSLDGLSTRSEVVGMTYNTIARRNTTLKYQVDGTKLMFIIDCPPNAQCAGPTEGIIDESQVILPYSIYFGPKGGELILTRVK